MSETNSLTVRDVMRTKIVSLRPDADVMDAMRMLATHRVSGAPVIDERENLVGVLTERDCLHTIVTGCYLGASGGGPVEDFMSTDVKSVDPAASLLEVAQLFDRSKYRRFPVLEENVVVGLVSRRDVVIALMELS